MRHQIPHDPLERINAHRLDELEVIARAFGGVTAARVLRAERVDAQGIDIAVESPGGCSTIRVAFLETVSDYPSRVRVAFVRLLRHARAVLAEADIANLTEP